MAELYDERRQEPRFAAQGLVRVTAGDTQQKGELHDLSLNGFRLQLPDAPAFADGQHVDLQLDCDGAVSLSAEGVVVHVEERHLGIEFWNMSSEDFDALTSLIDHLRDQGLSDSGN